MEVISGSFIQQSHHKDYKVHLVCEKTCSKSTYAQKAF